MKRLTFGPEPEMMDGASIAQEVMLLLARSSGGVHGGEVVARTPPRVFECKTCRRRFPSFQALVWGCHLSICNLESVLRIQ
uniref:C2H2-type domain-containing protein n=1 Tax=Leersia perrieri TaxID=77586 RepID=A0A0D9W0S2_9ORYZ